MGFEIKIENADKLSRAMVMYPQIAEPWVSRAMTATKFVFQSNTLKNNPVPWRTGNLLQSFRHNSYGSESARWYPTASYAAFVQFGTRPHIIAPRNKPFLAWNNAAGKGGYVTSKTGRQYYKRAQSDWVYTQKPVHHPGTKANPYMDAIRDTSAPAVHKLFADAYNKVVHALANQTA